jgi:hypothetical protein
MQVTIAIKATKIDPILSSALPPSSNTEAARLTQIAQISAIAEVNTGERTAPEGLVGRLIAWNEELHDISMHRATTIEVSELTLHTGNVESRQKSYFEDQS